MKMKMKNTAHRYDINRPSSRDRYQYSKYKKCHRCLNVLSNTYATFQAQFVKKLSNADAELKEAVLIKCVKSAAAA